LRNRVALATAYAAGLRIGEVSRLQVTSIDSSRKLIHVVDGKGGRDRYAMLSPALLDILRAYWRRARPGLWLFPAGKPASMSALPPRRTLAGSRESARGLANPSRRTRFGIALPPTLESGTDIRIIQVLLGHAELTSTTRYAQVATNLISATPSPFDSLSVKLIPPE
jgi:site-specific recombinase XerD